MADHSLPFGGLFRTDIGHVPRAYNQGLRWSFRTHDVNESARALFRRLDEIFEILKAPDYVFLSSIELDAEVGRFPEVLAQYFGDEAWSDTQSYFLAPIKRTGRDSQYATGRLTFEAALGQTVRVLAHDGGFRWGSALRVWGLQVAEVVVPEAIEMSPDDVRQATRIEPISRAAWVADTDLDSLALWLSPSVGEVTRGQLAALKTA